MSVLKKHILSDGSVTTTNEVMERTGLSRQGSIKRLQQTKDIDLVFLAKGDRKVNPYGKRYMWKSKPVTVIAGIPVNPEYLDGIAEGNEVYDRDGNVLNFKEKSGLIRYRERMRQEWRDGSKTIRNRDMIWRKTYED
tara:strand:+ start:613 stop:1023 length:411 start_codon:yes stop_codon:yes gene_type:complete